MWGYKCHKVLGWFIWPVIGFMNFIMDFSWSYAHYTNGNGPKLYKKGSFKKRLASSWRYRNGD